MSASTIATVTTTTSAAVAAPAALPAVRPQAVTVFPVEAHVQIEQIEPRDHAAGASEATAATLHPPFNVFEGEEVALAGGPGTTHALLAPITDDDVAAEPLLLKPLNWLSDPIASLSRGARALVSVAAVLSFVASCAALGYVLVITHGQY
jgi:hypothetical protein